MEKELMKTLSEHGRLGIAQQFDYSKFLLYSLITQSTAIEGSTVTEVENQLLFDEGIPPEKHNLSEVMMNLWTCLMLIKGAFNLLTSTEIILLRC